MFTLTIKYFKCGRQSETLQSRVVEKSLLSGWYVKDCRGNEYNSNKKYGATTAEMAPGKTDSIPGLTFKRFYHT